MNALVKLLGKLEVAMGEKKKKRRLLHALLLSSVALLILFATGAGSKEVEPTVEEVAEPRVITARFTDPADLEPQFSEKCIACHTKTNPITKLASPPSTGGGEAGG